MSQLCPCLNICGQSDYNLFMRSFPSKSLTLLAKYKFLSSASCLLDKITLGMRSGNRENKLVLLVK